MRKLVETGRRMVYKNPWMRVLELTIDRDGHPDIYGVVERPNSVAMIVRVEGSQILLLNQYRFPTGAESWEIPMGGIDDGENPEAAARRELREETGLEVDLQYLGSFHPIPGLTPQIAYVFVTGIVAAANVHMDQMPGIVDEIVARRLVPAADLGKLIAQGQISDGFTLCSLALLRYLT